MIKLLLPVCFFITSTVFAQLQKCNTQLNLLTLDPANFPKEYTVLVRGNTDKLISSQTQYGLKINYAHADIASVTGSLANLLYAANTNMVSRMELIKTNLRTFNDTMRAKNNLNAVHAGQAPLAMPYTGQGIIMGIIDSGIDYTRDDFKDANGKSRILYIWDQNSPVAGNTPMPYAYGQEWDSSYFNNNTCPHNDMPNFGHGTHVAGVAGAKGQAGGAYKGAAPDVEFIVVGVNFNANGPTIADAADYIYAKAAALGRPCIINASVGDYYGSHDGKDLQSQMIKNLLQTNGRLMAAAAGNSGSYFYHVGYTLANTDTNFTWITSNQSQINFQVYADVNDFTNVKYSIGANHPANYAEKGNIGFKNYTYSIGGISADTLYYGGNRIGIVQTATDTSAGVLTLDILITADSLNYLWSFESTGSGKLDSWNFSYVGGTSLPTTLQYPRMAYYKAPDSLQTIVSGFQCLDEVLTVANYINMNTWTNVQGNTVVSPVTANEISASSSHGPTRDGRQKPDIAATGDNIFSTAVAAMLPSLISGAYDIVSPDSIHVMGGGTSNASPVVAGLGALFLQMDSAATWWLFKQAVTMCSKQDGFTGSALPNEVWGYGKLDGFAAMTCATLGTKNTDNEMLQLSVFPNPASHTIHLLFAKPEGKGIIKLYDATGKMVYHSNKLLQGTISIQLENMPDGIYFYSVCSEHDLLKSGKIIHQQ